MKGLLIKDLRLLINQKRLFIMAICIAVVLTWTSEDVTFAATYIILLLSMLTLTTLSYDLMNGGMLFLLSLPVDRKLYTKEKYVFAFLNLLASAVVSLATCVALNFIKGSETAFSDLLAVILGITVGMALMLSVTIPFELKYGPEKGRVAMIVAVVVIAAGGAGIYKLVTDVLHVDVNGILTNLLAHLPQPGAGLEILIIGGLLAAIVIMLFVSYVVSLGIMKKKEF